MTVHIDVPDEIESTLRRRAADAGQDVESFLQRVIMETLIEELGSSPPKQASAAEFAKRLDSWIALHPVLNHAIDDSRESIYSGCGE